MLEFVLQTFYLHCVDRFANQFPQGPCGDLGEMFVPMKCNFYLII